MMADPNRVDPFGGDLDLSDFKPAAPKKPKLEAGGDPRSFRGQ